MQEIQEGCLFCPALRFVGCLLKFMLLSWEPFFAQQPLN